MTSPASNASPQPRRRTPPELKWLLNERAALSGVSLRQAQQVARAESRLVQAEAAVQSARAVLDRQRGIQEEGRRRIAALDHAIQLLEPTVNPAAAGVVQAHERYGGATGEGGIWARRCQYIDGHGNNVELRRVIAVLGVQRSKAFRFSILEIADVRASVQEVLDRESHWKRVLLTRVHSYNRN